MFASFTVHQVLSACMLVLVAGSRASADELPSQDRWAVPPGVPGPMIPEAGRSLFDHVFAANGRYDIPFPFTALLRKLEAQVGPDALGKPGVKGVLIPLGRSLQRSAGAPDFFRFPRVVVAVDGEAKSSRMPLLKDRLYVGYQESAAVLEVISYNEALGRFEFQVVKDYRAGATPRAFYANRTVCTACHQNAAPIFSRQQWDETNANPRLQARLASLGKRAYGVTVARGVDEPYAIDNATDRANRFAAYQMLWQSGCGTDDAKGIACRAATFILLLQYRLSGSAQFDRADPAFLQIYLPVLVSRWRELWPDGLRIPDPDLPNRDPAEHLPAHLSRAAADVPAQFDPLLPRRSLETWKSSNPYDLERLVRGLSEFLAEPDVLLVDRELRRLAPDAPLRSLRARCRFERKSAGGHGARLSFRCQESADPVRLRGRLYARRGTLAGGSLEGLSIGASGALAAADIAAGTLRERGGAGQAKFSLKRGALSVRAPDGNRIDSVELQWNADGTGEARVSVREDFPVLRAAVSKLQAEAGEGGHGLFAARPFGRALAMPALLTALGVRPGRWCCAEDQRLPPPSLERLVGTERAGAGAGLAGFYRHCAVCHDTADSAPPNFLAGESAQVRAQLQHCAPRIFVRLSMWAVPPPERAKTPMPPALAAHGMPPGQLRDDGALSALLSEVQAMLQAESSVRPRLEDYLSGGYEALRPCLRDTTH